MQQRIAVLIFRLIHSLQKTAKLLNVPTIDRFDFVDRVLLVLMMRKLMMAFDDSDFAE